MNLRRLEYFLVLGQTGNLRRAGEIIGVTPPALSKSMSVLEDEVGLRLWTRDGRKIILTDAGKDLMKKAPRLIDDYKYLMESLNEKSKRVKAIRIGTFEVFSTYFLRFMDELKWNDHSLELHELLPGEVEKYISQGDLDLGITYMPVPNPSLDFLKITSIEMGVYTRKGAFEGVPQQELPFVIPVTPFQSVPTRVKGLDGWPADAYQRKVFHRVTLMESALELCRQGRVAGYFPSFVVREHNSRVRENLILERRKSPFGSRICRAPVFLVKRKSDEETQIAKQLARALRTMCGDTLRG